MHEIIKIIDNIKSKQANSKGKYPVANFGFLACSNKLNINNVSFNEPCLIIVLSGVKTVYISGKLIECKAGECLAVPAPSILNLTNLPDMLTGKYQALVIPITIKMLQNIKKQFTLPTYPASNNKKHVIHYNYNETFLSSIKHYLTTEQDTEELLLNHRITEFLLILAKQNRDIFQFIDMSNSYAQKVRAILSEDITHPWSIKQVCNHIAVSESTLRRYLRREGLTFRDILMEIRLSTALMNLLQTNRPIYQIASDSGYESASRFTENFRDRFGLVPTEFRKEKTDSGY